MRMRYNRNIMELPRGFKGVWIPKEIWLAEDMSLSEKIILAEIDSLDQKNGCFAKNEHFAKFIEKSEKQVSRIIAKLKEKGMIEVTQENIKGVTRRTIRTDRTFMGGRGGQKRPEGVDTYGDASMSNTISNTGYKETMAQGAKVETPKFSIEGADVIKAFEMVDPKNKTYYGNKTQRLAADFIINEYGLENVLKVINDVLPKSNNEDYCPRITSPYDLKEKWQKLAIAMQSIKNKKPILI